jgi:hypothetical protein
MTYSRFPAGEWGSTNVQTNVVYIGGTAADLSANEQAVRQALVASGIDPAQSGFVFTNLLDYVDADAIPRDLAAAYTEAVPMINELVVTGRVIAVGSMLQVGVQVATELFYPFVKPSPNTFWLERADLSVTVSNVTATNAVSPPINPALVTIPSGYSSNVDTQWYGVAGIEAPQIIVASLPGDPGDSLRITVRVRLRVRVGGMTGPVVDACPWPSTGDPLSVVVNTTAPLVGMGAFGAGKECIDPRYNWTETAFTDSSSPVVGGSSLGRRNGSTSFYFTNTVMVQAGIDRDTSMHVSDAGRLYSAGELGHLLRNGGLMGNWYKTVRLFNYPDRDRDDVLRHFTTRQETVRHGLVNVNTRSHEILQAVFTNMPMGYAASSNRLTSVADMAVLVNGIVTGPRLKNLSELADNACWTNSALAWNAVEREAALAYSCNLMSTRQNLFVVLIAAGPFSRGLGRVASMKSGDWLGTQRAVVVLWRDPFPNADGVNPCRVRLFKWLED